MRQLHPILIVIGFKVRANTAKARKRFGAGFLTTLALAAGLVLFPAQAKAAYVATELAVLTEATTRVVRKVNGSTEVVGGARLADGRHQGFLLDGRVVPIGSIWGREVPQNNGPFQTRALALPIDPGSDYSTAFDINDFGDIAGSANSPTGLRAFKSHRNTAYIELGPLSGDTSSAAFGINLRAEVVGYSSGPNGTRAVIWNPGGIVRPLPALSGTSGSRALAINDPGDVVGVSETPSGPHATLWDRRGTVQDLGTLPGHGVSEALAIDESGDVVGSSGNLQQRRAVLWIQGGAIRDLGTLPGGASSRALGIGGGEVVGTSQTGDGDHAFLWTEAGGMQDLNSLLTSRSGFVLTQAVSITSLGDHSSNRSKRRLAPNPREGSPGLHACSNTLSKSNWRSTGNEVGQLLAMNTKPRLSQRCPFKLLVAVVIALCFGALQGVAQQSVVGAWSTVNALPFFPVHSHALPTGKVMIWPGDEGISGNDPRSWDPANQSVSPLTKAGYDLFCAGHAFLADGRLFVAGGHIENGVGLANASIYDPFANVWTHLPAMNAGRWYPTVTVLANGDVLVVSGSIDNTFAVNTVPQVFQFGSGTWRNLTELGQDLYPQMYLAPNGKVFNPAPSQDTRYLDTAGSGTWSFVARRAGPHRDYGSGVMYAPGKIVVMGGGDPPTNTAEVIDLNQPSPTWRAVGSMAFARRQLNATLLPDGNVLVTGGTSSSGFNNPTGAVHAAELWNPTTEQWTTLASSSGFPRVYHSTALLLPDGRVLSMGGNGFPQTEIYSPPYLFKGTRPTITSAPTSVALRTILLRPNARRHSNFKGHGAETLLGDATLLI